MKQTKIYIILLLLITAGCSSYSPTEQVIASPTAAAIATNTPSLSLSATPTMTLTPTITNTPTPTHTETHTLTPTPEPYTKLEDLKPLLSEEEQQKIAAALKNEYGDTWEALKYYYYKGKPPFWTISVASEDKFINLIEKPLQLHISEDKTVNMLVGMRNYYLDLDGDIQSVVVPVVLDDMDGMRYYLGGPLKDPRVDWEQDEIMDKLEEYSLNCNTCVGEAIGNINVLIAFPGGFDEGWSGLERNLKNIYDEFPKAYFLWNVLKPYMEMNADAYVKFLEKADPNVGVYIPWDFSKSGKTFSVTDWDR